MPTISPPGRFCILLVLASLCPSTAHSGKPDWVLKRPFLPDTYVGIGMAQKTGPAAGYTETARNIALNDIASQITVSISSDVLRRVFETHESLGEEFQSHVRASAKADLEGVQIVDTYENDDEYWVYCSISKADYQARRAATMKNAVTMAIGLYSSAHTYEKNGNIPQALGLYAQAFGPIEKYMAEPLEVEYGGRTILLVNELYNSLQNLLQRITLNTVDGKRMAKIGRPLKPPLEISATLEGPQATAVPQLPLTFSFTRGSGSLADMVKTDQTGKAICDVHKITASERIQVIEAKVSLQNLISRDSIPPVVQTVVRSLSVPTARFVLTVSGVDVVVQASESMFGQPLKQNRIEPVLKSYLGERGFAFVNDLSRASLAITIKADARKGSQAYGLAFSLISASVSVLDLETGQEVFKSSVDDVKEGSDNFEKAAYKGFTTAADRIVSELLPGLIDKVRK